MFLFVLVVAIIALERPVADFVMRQHIIGQHQRVAARRVAEMEADAVAFHLAAGEGQIGFAVLDGVFQLRIALAQLDFQGRLAQTAIVGQQLLQDLDHGFIVENPLVAAFSGQPEPRPQGQVIAVAVLAHTSPAGAGDDTVKGAHFVVRFDFHGGVGAD